jgi:hypothetical protein
MTTQVFYSETAVKDAKRLVRLYHYSHNPSLMPAYTATWHVPGGLFGKHGPAIAAAVYNHPVGGGKDSHYHDKRLLELKRLVRHPDYECPPLSQLISQSANRIRQLSMADLLISYADIIEDHHGGVYQACSWNYHGARKPIHFITINGVKVAPRGLNSKHGTSGIGKLKKLFPTVDIDKGYDLGKHLYWKPLNKKGKRLAESMGFECNPYPKPDRVPTVKPVRVRLERSIKRVLLER